MENKSRQPWFELRAGGLKLTIAHRPSGRRLRWAIVAVSMPLMQWWVSVWLPR